MVLIYHDYHETSAHAWQSPYGAHTEPERSQFTLAAAEILLTEWTTDRGFDDATEPKRSQNQPNGAQTEHFLCPSPPPAGDYPPINTDDSGRRAPRDFSREVAWILWTDSKQSHKTTGGFGRRSGTLSFFRIFIENPSGAFSV